MAKPLTLTQRTLNSIPVSLDHPSLAKAQAWLNDWRPENGEPPTPAMLWVGAVTKKHGLGLEGLFVAMQLRPEGATVQSFMRASGAGGAAHNNTRALVKAGLFERLKTAGPGQSETFTLAFTEAGARFISDRMVADGLKKPSKPKAVAVKAKANKAKAKPVETPVDTVTVELVTETPAETVTPDQLEALAAQFNS